jgi:HlyD family secretion protein
MRKIIIAVVILAVVATLAFVAWQSTQAAPQPVVPLRTEVVGRHTIESAVNASGSLQPGVQLSVAFNSAGRVTDVLVRAGDRVAAGQALAHVETSTLALDLADAQNQLAQSRLKLRQLNEPALAGDVAADEANLISARSALTDLLRGPDANAVEIARLGVERARIQLWQSQLNNPDPALRGRLPDYLFTVGQLRADSGEMSLQQAQINYAQAKQGATRAQIDAARAQVRQSEIQVERLKSGPSQAELDVAEAQVHSAELAVQAAQSRLDAAVLRAPAAGLISAVNVHAGELASPGAAAVALVDLSHFHVDVSVDELDVARLQGGVPVTVTVDALPDLALPGRITQIALLPGNSGGAVVYTVRVELAAGDPGLRAGMTAGVIAVTERRANVVAVPTWAVNISAETGDTSVTVQRDGQFVKTPVTLGLADDQYTEVLTGLNEGETVVLLPQTTQATTGIFFGAPPN